jgi:hypothetical protein
LPPLLHVGNRAVSPSDWKRETNGHPMTVAWEGGGGSPQLGEPGAGPPERDPVGAHPHDGDDRRSMAAGDPLETVSAPAQLLGGELVRVARGPTHQVGDAQPQPEQVAILER